MVMIPLLEMCGTSRARHIASPIMTYNKLAKYPSDDAITKEGERNGFLIDSRPAYPRLENQVRAGMMLTARWSNPTGAIPISLLTSLIIATSLSAASMR